MADFPELLILRHGETEWNRLGRMQGSLDSALTPLGRMQAEAQNRILARTGAAAFRWFASPRGRTMETARIAGLGLTSYVEADARLAEIDMGRWTGLLRDEIAAEAPHLFANGATALDLYRDIPGGETLGAVAARLTAFLDELTGPSVIVTHGIASRILRCIALGFGADAFDTLEGGQGVVYRVAPGRYEKLIETGGDPRGCAGTGRI